MTDTITIYLEKIEKNTIRIFYSPKSYSFTVENPENIKLVREIICMFPAKKSFIEDSQEEFLKDGRSSDDLFASVLSIKGDEYNSIVSLLEKAVIERTKKFENEFNEKRREACSSHSELYMVFNFFTRYEDLKNDSSYSEYAYYVIDGN